jgi:hypothetical protein
MILIYILFATKYHPNPHPLKLTETLNLFGAAPSPWTMFLTHLSHEYLVKITI